MITYRKATTDDVRPAFDLIEDVIRLGSSRRAITFYEKYGFIKRANANRGII